MSSPPLSNDVNSTWPCEVSSSATAKPFLPSATAFGADLGTRQSMAENWFFKQRKICVVLQCEM